MSAEQVLQRVQGELQRRFRIAGRGAVSRVQEQLQLGAGYFRDLRRPGRQRFDLRILLEALGALGVDAAEFFSSVLGSADPMDTFLAEAAALRCKLKRDPKILVLVDQRPDEFEAIPCDQQALDDLRLEDPRRAMKKILSEVSRTADEEIPMLLGVYGSCCRLLGQEQVAHLVLARALEMASEQDDLETLGDLQQRSCFVLASRTDYEGALALSEKAMLTHVLAGNLIGIGKNLVSQGFFLASMERFDEATRVWQRAMDYLPIDSTRPDVRTNRFSCYLNIGVICLKSGDLENAKRSCAQARNVAAVVNNENLGKAIWLEAPIFKKEGDLQKACLLLHEALELYREINPISAALIAIDLVRLQLKIGRTVTAYETAKAMATLVKPLESNKVASAAITELVRCAIAGRGLTASLLDEISRGIEKERARPASRAPR